MGVFRRCIRKVYDLGAAPSILSERETTRSVVLNGVETQRVLFERVDVSKTAEADNMPNASEWDLDEQIKSGYKPEQLSVKGMLPVDGELMEAKTIMAFNNLQSQIDSLKVSENVESSNND